LQVFSGELSWLAIYGGGETILRGFCSSALWQSYQTLYLFFRMQEFSLQLNLRVQECIFTTLSQVAGITVLSVGGWDTHSFALGLQTQQLFFVFSVLFFF
jgi:hypothetical protein